MRSSWTATRRTALELLALPEVDFQTLARIWPELGGVAARHSSSSCEIDAQYAGYLDRQDADILAFRRDESLTLPADLDYRPFAAFRPKSGRSWSRIRPATLGQAARIDGVTPAALTLVLAHVQAPRAAEPCRA